MNQTIMVEKRDGARVPLDLNKFHKVVMWACNNIANVSPS